MCVAILLYLKGLFFAREHYEHGPNIHICLYLYVQAINLSFVGLSFLFFCLGGIVCFSALGRWLSGVLRVGIQGLGLTRASVFGVRVYGLQAKYTGRTGSRVPEHP